MTSCIDVRVESAGEAAVRVVLAGDIDLSVADTLFDTLVGVLSTDQPKRVEIDLTGVRLLDASAVGVLLAARNRARSCGARVRVDGAAGLPRQVLEICGVLKMLAGDP